MKRSLRVVVVLAASLSIGPGLLFGQAAAGLDQYNLLGTTSGLTHSANPVGQWFTVGREGLLAGVELCLSATWGNTETLVFEVRDTSGGLPGVTLGTLVLTPADFGSMQLDLDPDLVTATLIDLSGFEIAVEVGDQIGIWMATAMPSPDGYIFRYGPDTYPAGQMTTLGGGSATADLVFKTFVAEPIFDDDFESGDTSAWSNGEIAFVTTTPHYSDGDISSATW